jgi:hypothetical protein
MAKGFYRSYFHIGSIGFKFARISFQDANPFIAFTVACIMNQLEWKRYRYYVKGKSFRQWGRKWKYDGITPIFCPVYFSCGIFSIVKHLPKEVTWEELIKEAKVFDKKKKLTEQKRVEEFLSTFTAWLVNDLKPENFRRDKNGNLYCIDYGEFVCGNLFRQSACLIDYK